MDAYRDTNDMICHILSGHTPQAARRVVGEKTEGYSLNPELEQCYAELRRGGAGELVACSEAETVMFLWHYLNLPDKAVLALLAGTSFQRGNGQDVAEQLIKHYGFQGSCEQLCELKLGASGAQA